MFSRIPALARPIFKVFVLFAALGLWRLPAIAERDCPFFTNWLTCSAAPSAFVRGITLIIYTAAFVILWRSGRKVWQLLTTGEALPVTESLAKKLTIALVLIAALTFPFGSADLTYNFGAGEYFGQGVNLYTEHWETLNPFFLDEPRPGIPNGYVYGPITPHLFAAIYRVSGDSYVWFGFIWKLIQALVLILVGFTLHRIINPKAGKWQFTLTVAMLPLVLFEWVVGAHFDGAWVLFVLLALRYAKLGRWFWVWPLLTIGVWLKFLPVFFAPWFVLWWWQSVMNKQSRSVSLRDGIAGVILSLGITVGLWAPFWEGMETVQPIMLQAKWAIMSLFWIVYSIVQPIATAIFGEGYHIYTTATAHGIVFVLAVFLLWPLVRHVIAILLGRKAWPLPTYTLAMTLTMLVYLMIWQKSFWPWYVTWLLPFALITIALRPQRILNKIFTHLSVAPFWFYLLFLPVWYIGGYQDPTPTVWFAVLITAVVWLYPALLLLWWRVSRYDLDVDDQAPTPTTDEPAALRDDNLSTHTYSFDQAPYSTHMLLLEQVPQGSRVLDVGSAGGYMGEYLIREKGCSLVGIEPDPATAAEAKTRGYEAMVAKTVEDALGDDTLQPASFDVIFCADVLEHLVNPQAALVGLTRFLKPGGQVIISLPNVAHYSVRQMLLKGQWQLEDAGIMDRTHLRWFTRETLHDMVVGAGLTVIKERPLSGGLERFGLRKLLGVGQKLLFLFPSLFAVQLLVIGKKK